MLTLFKKGNAISLTKTINVRRNVISEVEKGGVIRKNVVSKVEFISKECDEVANRL